MIDQKGSVEQALEAMGAPVSCPSRPADQRRHGALSLLCLSEGALPSQEKAEPRGHPVTLVLRPLQRVWSSSLPLTGHLFGATLEDSKCNYLLRVKSFTGGSLKMILGSH